MEAGGLTSARIGIGMSHSLLATDSPRDVFAAIDWQQPWLAPLAQTGERAAAQIGRGASVADALDLARTNPDMEFVAQDALPQGMAYEQFIFEQRRIPTRNNLHDFFNGLIWLHYPKVKRLLNRWQAAEIAQQGVGAVRGPLRDAITVFDENGALLIAPEPLRVALKNREWRKLGVDFRPLWQQSQLVLVGHALLEKLVQPRKNITAHVFLADDTALMSDEADVWMAQHFDAPLFATKPFNPLPVLGVPGWCDENQNFCFYDDSEVFRSATRKISQQVAAVQAG